MANMVEFKRQRTDKILFNLLIKTRFSLMSKRVKNHLPEIPSELLATATARIAENFIVVVIVCEFMTIHGRIRLIN